jgi:c-di-GMP-binding flagellar brake protein YcgR
MKERRKIQRIELSTPARIEALVKDGNKISLKAETKDISSHGAYFLTKDIVEENTKLDIELLLSMGKLLELLKGKKQIRIVIQGTVIRSDKDGIAVSFGRRYQIIQTDL